MRAAESAQARRPAAAIIPASTTPPDAARRSGRGRGRGRGWRRGATWVAGGTRAGERRKEQECTIFWGSGGATAWMLGWSGCGLDVAAVAWGREGLGRRGAGAPTWAPGQTYAAGEWQARTRRTGLQRVALRRRRVSGLQVGRRQRAHPAMPASRKTPKLGAAGGPGHMATSERVCEHSTGARAYRRHAPRTSRLGPRATLRLAPPPLCPPT